MSAASIITGVTAADLEAAAAVLRRGGVVAFPTETYYGLAVDPFSESALARLFAVKQRAADKPVLTLIADRTQLALLTPSCPDRYEALIAGFWPGPLTLLFTARPGLPASLSGGTGTIGVRIPSHAVARRLATCFGGPITGTSANLSAHPAATSAAEVSAQLGERLDLILDGGVTPGGCGSTIVGCDRQGLVLVRDGVIPFEQVAAVCRSANAAARRRP